MDLRLDKNIFAPKTMLLVPFLSLSLYHTQRGSFPPWLREGPRRNIVVVNARGNAFFRFRSLLQGWPVRETQ